MADFNTLYEQLKASAQSAAKSANTLVTMMTADENTDVGIDGFGLKPSFSKQLKIWTQPLIDQMSAFLDQSVATFDQFLVTSVATFDQFLVTSGARVTQFLQNSGYQVIGDYTDGPYTLGNYNSVVKYDGSLYKLKSDTDVPFTTTGATASSWVNDSSHFYAIGGDVLSQQLASDLPGNGSSLIGDEVDGTVKAALVRSRLNTREIWRRSLAEAGLTLVDGSFEEGATVNSKTDVVWHSTGGQCYAWNGVLPKDIPAGFNPVGAADWSPQTDTSLRNDLMSPTLPGASLVMHSSGNTVEAELDKLSSSAPTTRIYKDFVFDRSLRFSGYETALATIGGTYLIPQGFDISEDNLVFVNMVSSLAGPTLRAIVVYSMAGVELTWFYIADSGLQSLSVTGSLPNIKLYDGGIGVGGYLQEYTLTALPAAGSTVSDRVSTGVTGFTSLFCVRNGYVACFSSAARIGIFTNDDSVITIRSLSTGDVKSTIQVSRMVVGFTTGSMYGIKLGPDYQTQCWKLQGIAFAKNGNILLSVGAYWETGNSQTKAAPNLGVIELNVQGEIVRHSVVNNQAFRDWLDSKGYDNSRTENEGLAVDADGNVFALYIGQFLPDNGGHNLFLSKEFASSGFDVSKYYSLYRPLPQRDLENPIRASNGRYENPILHSPFVDSPDLLRYMVLMNVRKFAWFSQIEPQLTFTGVPWSSVQKCELWNMNNGSFILTNTSTAEGFSNFRISYDLVAHTYTVTKIRIKTNAVHTDVIVTDGGNTMTLDQQYWYPATAGSLTLGTAAKPFAALYVQTAPVVTSDRRAKFDEAEIDDVEKLLARDLVKLIKRYRLKTSKDKLHFGVIAQEVVAAFAEHNLSAEDYSVVETDDDSNLAVNYTELMLLVISSM